MKAASAALGEPLSAPAPLGDPGDCAVVRCRSPRRGSVIVKSYDNARGSFTAEAAGLALKVGGPDLLAVDMDHPLIVMTDLGEAPSLADALLGDDPHVARDGLLDWARGLGTMARKGFGRQGELEELRRRYGPKGGSPSKVSSSLRGMERVPAVLAKAGMAVPDGLADDLAELGRLADDDYAAFTPGDTCPDNNLLTRDGVRFLDFESAGYPSVFLTAAYCRIPFATCWCVFRLDPDLTALAEDAFRTELLPVFPELRDDGLWQAGVRRGLAAWSAWTMLLFPDTIAGDPPLYREAPASPTIRQLLVYRCEVLLRELTQAGDLPALAETAALLLRLADREWNTPPLPPYPAFT